MPPAPALAVCLMALLCLASYAGAGQKGLEKSPGGNRLLPVGAQAPGWVLSDAAGAQHKLSDYRGKVVVMDFWATWCGPCEKLMPKMQKLQDEFGARGVVVFGLNSWERNDPAELMSKKRLTYGLLLKGEEAAAAYGVVNLPVVYIVGVDGKVIYRREGLGGEDLSKVIEKHLAARGM